MKTSKKPILLPLTLLLVPTLLVAWIGLRQFGGLEEQLRASLSASAATLLRGVEVEYRGQVERLVDRSFAEIDGLPREGIIAVLEQLPEEDDAVPAGFLVSAEGKPVFPTLPRRTWTGVGEPIRLLPQPRRPPKPKEQDLIRLLRESDYFAAIGEPQAALAQLEAASELEADPQVSAELSAAVGVRRGRCLLALGETKKAIGEFVSARVGLEVLDRSRPDAAYLLLILGELEAEGVLARRGAQDRREKRESLTVKVLEGVSHGEFDSEPDDFLDYVFSKAGSLVVDLIDEDHVLRTRVDSERARNQDRVARRFLMRQVQELGFGARLGTAPDPTVTLPLAGAQETSLLAFRRIHDKSGTVFWAGVQIDLATLVDQSSTELLTRLASDDVEYRVDFLDPGGRPVLIGLDDRAARAEAGTDRLRTALALARPLAGFSLVAEPRDPRGILDARRRRILVNAILLIGLAVVAGGAAFLLLRALRREGEVARLKTDFVGRVSHELKTPLSLIRMYGETIAMGRVGDHDKARRFASIIAKESDRLSSMIDNILDFSQIDAGTKDYKKARHRIDLHLRSVLENYAPHLEEQGLALVYDDFQNLTCEVDPSALSQAVLNLIGNARKYSEGTGATEIEVRVSRNSTDALIEVLDRGVGVPTGESERIFETFYRASTAGERRGAGLGLALVRHFARAHGGTAECEARPGGGSVFRIRLPLNEAVDGAEEE